MPGNEAVEALFDTGAPTPAEVVVGSQYSDLRLFADI
jgi:hypothetical protein